MQPSPTDKLRQDAAKFAALSKEEQEHIKLVTYANLVNKLDFSVEGFLYFYWCITRREPPPHVRKWAEELYAAKVNGSGVLLEAHRGATKSTILFCWVLYVQGKRPVGSTVLVRINDAAAAETGNAMAEIIEKSLAWKLCFPHVLPDKDRRWSTEGWFVKDERIPYAQWIQQTTADHLGEPSLLTAGITSGIHIGKHPSNGWYADDFHDEQNTRSRREMQNIVDTIEKNIIPTWNRPEGHPTLAVACTLWNENDGYHSLLKTGLFKHVKTPIMSLDPTSPLVYPGYSYHDQHVRLAWPEAYTLEKVVEIEKQNPVWFPVMYLCNLESLKGSVLKREWIHEYPAEKIGETWPVYFGVDFASTDDRLHGKERDYFALAVGRSIPGGGVVLVDGLRGQFPAADSMGHLQAFAAKYPTLVTIGLEKWGAGSTFKSMLVYNTDLPVVPCPFKGAPVKSKGQRFQSEDGLAPMFTDGRLWVSSDFIKTDFAQAFLDEWVGWDGSASITGHDDTLDAVYWTSYIAQGHLIPPKKELSRRERNKKPDPYKILAHAY